jgi:hypothetical protein
MALSANTPRTYEFGELNDLPVKASSTIYQGSAVGITSGYARALVAGDIFTGFATAKAVGGSADGDVKVNVQVKGLIKLTITSIAVTDIGKPVYASADGTFTLTQSTNSRIGTVHRYVTTDTCVVAFDGSPASGNLTGVTALTDSSGGASADGTIGAVTTFTPSVAWNGSSVYPSAADATAIAAAITALMAAVKELSTKQNEVIAALKL